MYLVLSGNVTLLTFWLQFSVDLHLVFYIKGHGTDMVPSLLLCKPLFFLLLVGDRVIVIFLLE